MTDYAFIVKDPDRAYLGTQLWLPKKHVNKIRIKASLEFEVYDAGAGEQVHLQLWEETEDHLAVPREYVPTNEYQNLSFPIVDMRPASFPRADFTSKLVLDAKAPDEDTQKKAFKAFAESEGGLLRP